MRNSLLAQGKVVKDDSEQSLGLQGEGCTIHSQYQSLFQNMMIRKTQAGSRYSQPFQPNQRVKCIDLRQLERRSSEKTAITYSQIKDKEKVVRNRREKVRQLEKEGCMLPCPLDGTRRHDAPDGWNVLKDLISEYQRSSKESAPTEQTELRYVSSNKSSMRIKLRRLLRRSVLLSNALTAEGTKLPIKVDGMHIKTEHSDCKPIKEKRILELPLKHHSSMLDAMRQPRQRPRMPQHTRSKPSTFLISRTVHNGRFRSPTAGSDELITPWEGEI